MPSYDLYIPKAQMNFLTQSTVTGEKNPQVSQQLENLQSDIDTLDKAVSILSNRLERVLSPAVPNGEKIQNGATVLCELAENLLNKSSRINVVISNIQSILDRLEV